MNKGFLRVLALINTNVLHYFFPTSFPTFLLVQGSGMHVGYSSTNNQIISCGRVVQLSKREVSLKGEWCQPGILTQSDLTGITEGSWSNLKQEATSLCLNKRNMSWHM